MHALKASFSAAEIQKQINEFSSKMDRMVAAKRQPLSRFAAAPTLIMTESGMTPDPWQLELLKSTEQQLLLLCARQVGKSQVVAYLALKTALTQPGSTTVVIAPIQPQASEMLRKVRRAYNALGRPIPLVGDAVTSMELANGSRILALPGKERSVHSYTNDLLILDEAARIPDEVFMGAGPTLSVSKGRLVCLSTAFSKSGWFYKEWTEGVGYRRLSITAHECPRHSKEFLARERKKMGEWWFNMAYLNIFGDDIAAVFRIDDIKAALVDGVAPLFPQFGAANSGDDLNGFAAGSLVDDAQPLFAR